MDEPRDTPDAPDSFHFFGHEAFLDLGDWLDCSASSNVSAAQYDKANETLTVEYKDGSIWQYGQISYQEAEAFANAGSRGTWIWDNIKVRGTVHQHQKPAVKLTAFGGGGKRRSA